MSDYEINGNRVLFFYIHDKREPRRVATLARFRDGNDVYYAWAINRFSEEAIYQEKFDYFTKKRGREIAFGRLSKERSRRVVSLAGGIHGPLEAMLIDIADTAPLNDIYGDRIPAPNLSVPRRLVDLADQSLDEYQIIRAYQAWFGGNDVILGDGEEDDNDDVEEAEFSVSTEAQRLNTIIQLNDLFKQAAEEIEFGINLNDNSDEESSS